MILIFWHLKKIMENLFVIQMLPNIFFFLFILRNSCNKDYQMHKRIQKNIIK